jgi:hypothetical protein
MKALFSLSLHSDICRFAPVGSAACRVSGFTDSGFYGLQHPDNSEQVTFQAK